ncbi:hypothetical protein ACH4XT_34710 [Streptomyces avidinii]|uniref:hypothetical protein n=1 Tax=Streptomyces avidinii TaxID=1895 RepID=UPI0037943801
MSVEPVHQRGHTDRRRFLLIAGLPLLTAGAGLTYLLWPGRTRPSEAEVRTDTEPLNRRLRLFLGELTDAHWLGYDIDESGGGDRSIPGPDSRVRLVGVAHLSAGGAAAITGRPEHAFAPAAPSELSELPDALKQYVPAAAWQHSPGFDAYANETGPEGTPSGRYLFDTARDLVQFDIMYLYT